MDKIFYFCLFYILVAKPVLADPNWEYWSEYSVDIPVNDGIDFVAKAQFRFEGDGCYYFKVYLGQLFRVSEYFTIATYYVFRTKKAEQGWSDEDFGNLDATVKWKIGDFSFSDRNRFERNFSKGESLYRNKIKVKKPTQIRTWKIVPFIASEIFYDFNEFSENRTHLGISTVLIDGVEVELSYILRSKKQSEWSRANVLVTSLKYSFR